MTTFVSAARAGGPKPEVVHGFFDGPRPLFGSYHVPAPPVRGIGYVICPPLGWEGIQCYQSVQRLAAELAAAGFHAVRVHYDGSGESLGSDDDPGRVAAWLESVQRAMTALSGVRKVDSIGLVGIRLGATLAGVVAANTAVANLVLWEPCVSGAHYTREMEILASASPSAAQVGRDASRGIEAGGYLLTRETIASLDALDLQKTTPKGSPPVFVVCRDDRPPIFAKKLREHLEDRGCSALLEELPGHKEMMTYPERSIPATAIIERIRDWAVERCPRTIDEPPERLTLTESAVVERVRHRPVRFGPSQRLFGVLTEPVAEGMNEVPLLFLTGGVVPRTGVNRMYVVLAARLAELGHTVLRVDVAGICESLPDEGAAPNDPHAASLLGDVRAAVELLLATTGHRTISLLGLCSGAYATFQTALADPRVVGATLLNPEVFHLKDGSTKFSDTEQSQAAKHYRQSLMSLTAWKKLLSGKANVRYIAGFVGARVKSTISSTKDRVTARIKKLPQGVAGDFHRLLSRGVRLNIVVAKGDPGYEPLMSVLGEERAALEAMGLRLKIVPGPDHTFNDFSVRRPLIDWLVKILSERPNGDRR